MLLCCVVVVLLGVVVGCCCCVVGCCCGVVWCGVCGVVWCGVVWCGVVWCVVVCGYFGPLAPDPPTPDHPTDRPKFRSFFPSPTTIFVLFLSLSGCFLVEFWFFQGRSPQMCTFGVLGLSCEAPAAPKPRGFHTTAREPKRVGRDRVGPRPT